jgi:hypothetical protein
LRRVPVLVKGSDYAFGQMLEPFAKLAGIDLSTSRLTPEQLFNKYQIIFAAGQRLIRQFPQERLRERVIPHRPRVIGTLGYHVFRIGEAFLETWDGAEYSQTIADNEPPAHVETGADIAQFGESVWQRYEAWWKGVEDRSLSRVLKTYYGDIEAHRVFERVTWHSAQHCRQLAAVLDRMGIEADRPLTPEDLKGLPLPERLWE